MATSLLVLRPFGPYAAGASITDPALVAALQSRSDVRIVTGTTPTPSPTPAPPPSPTPSPAPPPTPTPPPTGTPTAISTTPPLMDGAASAGTSISAAAGDHIHPADTSRYPASNPLGFQTLAQVTGAIQVVVGAAPAALATLKQIDDQLKSDESAAGALTTQVTANTAALATKGQAGGFAPLDGGGKVPAANLPASAGQTSSGATLTVGTTAGTVAAGDDSRIVGAQSASQVANAIQVVIGAAPSALNTLQKIDAALQNDESAAAALTALVSANTSQISARVPSGNAGAANGAAVLGSDGKVPTAQLPPPASVTIRPITGAGSVTVLASDAGGFIIINKTTGEATPVILLDGVRVTIVDGKGDAATNPITLTPPANGSINGQPTIVMSSAYDALGVLSYGGGKFGLY